MTNPVNFYRDDSTCEVLAICEECFGSESLADFMTGLSYIDKAGHGDICNYCDAENVAPKRDVSEAEQAEADADMDALLERSTRVDYTARR